MRQWYTSIRRQKKQALKGILCQVKPCHARGKCHLWPPCATLLKSQGAQFSLLKGENFSAQKCLLPCLEGVSLHTTVCAMEAVKARVPAFAMSPVQLSEAEVMLSFVLLRSQSFMG